MIRVFDTCSGIGGFSLGLESTGKFKTVAFCEIEDFCCKILNKHWPQVPIYNDLKELGNEPEKELFKTSTSSVEESPVSPSVKRAIAKEKRTTDTSGRTCLKLLNTKNPLGSLSKTLLASSTWHSTMCLLTWKVKTTPRKSFVIPACGIEAPHRSERVWIIGRYVPNPDCDEQRDELGGSPTEEGKDEERIGKEDSTPRVVSRTSSIWISDQGHEGSESMADSKSNIKNGISRKTKSKHVEGDTWMESQRSGNGQSKRKTKQDVANTSNEGLQGTEQHEASVGETETSGTITESFKNDGSQWATEPNVGRVANGVPNRVDRLKALGNAIVPQVIHQIGLAIAKEEGL